MRKIVVFTGAGVSEESGIRTFRGNNGLWEEFNIEDVATPQAWKANPKLVLDFYNKRRQQVIEAQPNAAHQLIANLEDKYDVQVITQNIDDLHERAGSSKVLHLHGEIMKSKSEFDKEAFPELFNVDTRIINWGEKAKDGGQLRPHVVWFGEPVPMMIEAENLVSEAEIFIVVGTSLNVYPAAGLLYNIRSKENYLIDPNSVKLPEEIPFKVFAKKAGEGMKELFDLLNK